MLSLPHNLFACATCLPDRGSAAFNAQQGAIGFMLIVTFAMLGTLLLILVNFGRKQRRALAAAAAAQAQPVAQS